MLISSTYGLPLYLALGGRANEHDTGFRIEDARYKMKNLREDAARSARWVGQSDRLPDRAKVA
jgi:hypothetical protein